MLPVKQVNSNIKGNMDNHKGYPYESAGRRSIRLKRYDYSRAGFYFITICVQGKKSMFGEIDDGKMCLNDAGQMVESQWVKLPDRFSNLRLHEYIVMPNHFHAILETVRAPLVGAQNDKGHAPTGKTLGDMVGAFKSLTTIEYIRCVKTKNWPRFNGKLWQRNYWEHIIRNETSYQNISEYIINNPLKWSEDEFYTK